MRWLVAEPGPSFSVMDTYTGWVEALAAAGEHVIKFPLGSMLSFYDLALLSAGSGRFKKALTAEQATDFAADRLCGALWKTRPDVLFIISGFFTNPLVLDQARRDGTKVVVLCTEEPYEHQRQLDLAAHVDMILVDDPTNLDAYKAVTRAEYMPKAYRPSVHCPGPASPALVCDLAFVGTGYQSRIDFFDRMDLRDLDVMLAGNWTQLPEGSPLRGYVPHAIDECLDNEQAVNIYRSAKVGLNLYRREAESEEYAVGWSMGPRELELAASQTFFLRDPRGEGDELLPMLPRFESPEEASDLLRYWLPRDDERRDLALKAREAIQDRTFDNHAARLLRLLEKE